MCGGSEGALSRPGSRPGDGQDHDAEAQSCTITNLHVRVVDDLGQPVAGATVTVTDVGEQPTDGEGWARWRPIAPGVHMVKARKALHTPAPAITAKAVPQGDTAEVELRIVPYALHLHVDADRDGDVDDDWTRNTPWEPGAGRRGAIVLFNNDNDDQDALKERDFENPDIDGQADLSDIAPLHLRRHPPGAALPADLTAVLSVSPPDMLRVFQPSGPAGTQIIGPGASSWHFSNAELSADPDIALGMEALQYPDAGFDGMVTVTLELREGGAAVHTEEAMLRVAPWILFNHAMQTVRCFVVDTGPMSQPSGNGGMRGAIDAELATAGLPPLVVASSATYESDRWMQDGMEPGFSAMPANGGQQATPATLRTPTDRAAQNGRPAGSRIDAFAKGELLGRDHGFHEATPMTTATNSLDSFGNLECSPPFTHSGAHGEQARRYPFGRAIYGGSDSTDARFAPRAMHARTRALLAAQKVQSPVMIHTNWLTVGHVDEFVSFLPDPNGGDRFKVLLASPRRAMEIVSALPSGTPLFTLPNIPGQFPPLLTRPDPWNGGQVGDHLPWKTCGQITADAVFTQHQSLVQAIIDRVRDSTLTPKLDRLATDYIEIPVLFHWKSGRYIAYTAGSVNMLVITPGGAQPRLCVPRPFGPVHGGICQFEADIRAKLGGIASIRFIDDFQAYHLGDGEIHCGTNSERRPPADKWWEIDWI